MRRALDPWLQGHLMGRNDFEGFSTERVYALLAKAPEIAALVEHPTVLSIIDALLPRDYLLSAALVVLVLDYWRRPEIMRVVWIMNAAMIGAAAYRHLDDALPAQSALDIDPVPRRSRVR